MQKVSSNEINVPVVTENNSLLEMLKLSIVIPVYNGEKFIQTCLDKVFRIPLNKEIIVINDCSQDQSLKILQEYSNQIILIDLPENHGVSHARNLGLQRATGDYITFIDVDDDFELEMHTKILNAMLQKQADVGICNNDIVEFNGRVLKPKHTFSSCEIEQSAVISNYLCDRIVPAVWSSIYRASLAKSVAFEEQLRIGEDILYVLQILLKAQKTCFVNEALYHYKQYPSSAMHVLSDKLLQYLQITHYLSPSELAILDQRYFEEFKYFKLEMVRRAVHAISLAAGGNRKHAKAMLKSLITKDVCRALIKNQYTPRYAKIEFWILKTFGVGFHLFVFPCYGLIRKLLRK